MMSFDKELRVVMISSIGILAYLLVASAVMYGIFTSFGEQAFMVAWLVILLIPLNFALCALLCIIFYKKKEKNFNEIKEHLTELSDLTIECEKKREEKVVSTRARASSE
jgi:uncharacterized membrane protein